MGGKMNDHRAIIDTELRRIKSVFKTDVLVFDDSVIARYSAPDRFFVATRPLGDSTLDVILRAMAEVHNEIILERIKWANIGVDA